MTKMKFPPQLNNVLTLPSENEKITFHINSGVNGGGWGDASPNILAGGCNASHPPLLRRTCVNHHWSHSTECGLSFFLYEW